MRAGMIHNCKHRGGPDSAALEFRQDAPASLVDRLALPLPFPVADQADRLAVGQEDDPEHAACSRFGEGEIVLVARENLLLALRPADVFRHLRGVVSYEEAKVGLTVRLDPDLSRCEVVSHCAGHTNPTVDLGDPADRAEGTGTGRSAAGP